MAGMKGIDDTIAFSLAQNCKNAVHVSFKNCNVTDSGVCEVATNCSKLSVLGLSGMADLTDKSVVALAENCHELSSLFLSGCPKITQQAITYLKVRFLFELKVRTYVHIHVCTYVCVHVCV